jgi:hypothetical protein
MSVGWLLTCSSLVCIPLYVLYFLIKTPGTLSQVRTCVLYTCVSYIYNIPPIIHYIHISYTYLYIIHIPLYVLYFLIKTPGTLSQVRICVLYTCVSLSYIHHTYTLFLYYHTYLCIIYLCISIIHTSYIYLISILSYVLVYYIPVYLYHTYIIHIPYYTYTYTL